MTVYDNVTIRIHWASAALVVALWAVGQTADDFPKGWPRDTAWSTHFTLGALLLVLWIARIAWRLTAGRRLPGLGSPAMIKLAAAGHGLLYLGVGGVAALGIANLYAHGSNIWGLIHFARITEKSLRVFIGQAHSWGADLLLILAAAHALAALLHQYVWRDGALARMLPRLAR
jgi:cytochrome b561